eukprot:TRINITY_DN5133_c0_g1_i2.p1 TRINITY_DN5133_c0_g1~~TRINITY_DN5133_c0_g1_i2.p1  ORF type:complete len:322 (+),score=8.55 TRINITY_DN5133_c0_g1_i2:94-966(+)
MAPPESTAPAGATTGGNKSRKRRPSVSLPPAAPSAETRGEAPVGGGRGDGFVAGAAGVVGGVGAHDAASGAGREADLLERDGGCDVVGHGSGSWSHERVVEELCARSLVADERIVATAELHPEWSTFHHNPTPISVVPCLLTGVADSCGAVTCPFGQDSLLCLKKGYPAANAVPLSAISSSYQTAWPVESIGEDGAALLGTACVWRAATPSVPLSTGAGSSSVDMRAKIVSRMPAVELFGVVCARGQTGADYLFTMAFYESAAYGHFKKQHFDDLLPKTIADAASPDGVA